MQKKAIDAHLAHLIVHGILHLLGRDHVCEIDASNMEAEEIGILNELGYANPYLSEDEHRT
jgi:Predicted metal-dependent hydrolase